MKVSIRTFAGAAVRIAALAAFLLALVPATHIHADELASSATCAPCSFAHARSAIAPTAPAPTVFLVASWIAPQPRAITRHRASNHPVGRAPPSWLAPFLI